MEILSTTISDLLLVRPRIFSDMRGYFYETYHYQRYKELGIDTSFCQDNQSKSSYGVIRGLHYQLPPHSQSKLVSVPYGKVWDVAVDLRKQSPTFGQWYGVELSDENHLQLFIPKGFAHGFAVLSDMAIVHYKCDNFYTPASEQGILYNDVDLAIDWKVPINEAIVAEKDLNNLTFRVAILNSDIDFS